MGLGNPMSGAKNAVCTVSGRQKPGNGKEKPKMDKEQMNAELIPALYGRGLLDKMHERLAELGMAKETLRQLTGIPKTTFYRLWNNAETEVHMDIDIALRVCLALGLSIDEHLRKPAEVPEISPPLSEAVHEEVVQNAATVLDERKQVIEEQAGEIEQLASQLEEKRQIENEHLRQILEMHSEIRDLHENYNRRIAELQRELSRRCDQICELAGKIAEK